VSCILFMARFLKKNNKFRCVSVFFFTNNIRNIFQSVKNSTRCGAFGKSLCTYGYGTYIWLSVPKLPLQCAAVSLYLAVKQRLKCNTGKVCNCLIQFYSVCFVDITSNIFYKCTATFRTHCS
jgi:hypothetical protein